MADKREPGRFTLRFNLNDPLQQAAVNILNRLGRQKAQFLAQALIHYTACEKMPNTSTPITLDEGMLEQAILTVFAKYPPHTSMPDERLLEQAIPTVLSNHPELPHPKHIAQEQPTEERVQAPSCLEQPESTPTSLMADHSITEETLNAINKTLKSFLSQ